MIDEKKLIEELEKIFETDEENIDCTLSDFAYHVFDCIKAQPKIGEWIPCSERLPDKKMDTDEDGLATVETTVILPNGELTTFIDDYMFNTGEFCTPYQVIAWRERPEPYREGDEVKKQTNADKIRNMTDEELAKEITEKIECTQCPYNDDCETCGVVECEKLFLDWLQSEADQKGQEL